MSSCHEKDNEVPKEEFEGCFQCSQCGMEETYHFKGARPRFAKCFAFSEEGYVMKDPFSPPGKGKCLMLGSDCSKCGKPVCCAPSCSVFYSQRYCVECLKSFSEYFPQEVLNKVLTKR